MLAAASTKCSANGSSIYPAWTALSLETAASVSVARIACSLRESFGAWFMGEGSANGGALGWPRPRPRPRGLLRSPVSRLGIVVMLIVV